MAEKIGNGTLATRNIKEHQGTKGLRMFESVLGDTHGIDVRFLVAKALIW